MATIYKDTGYPLQYLMEQVKHGHIALPDIQRPFVWKAAKVRDLLDSMYRGYPVGTLMLWETGAQVGTRQVGGGESDTVARALIVDGQQRLTSLYAVMTGRDIVTKSFEKRPMRIAFRPSDQTFEVADAAIERDAEFISDITSLWRDGYKSTVRRFFEHLHESSDVELTHQEQDELEERIDRVRDLRDFRFQVIELSAEADEEQVAEIFVRINSKGVQLNQADFILTLMSVHWEEGRRALESFCRSAVDRDFKGASARNPYLDPSADQMLRAAVGLGFRRGRLQYVYNLLRGKDLETGEVSDELRIQQFEALRQAQARVLDLNNWHEFLKVLAHAGFRSGKMITSDNAVIFTYVLWLVGKHDFGLDIKTLRSVIGRWFFMAQTTAWYTSSPESIIEADLARLRPLAPGDGEGFVRVLNQTISANLTGDYWDITLPSRLNTSSSYSPTLFAYWAALNLLDAELLFSTQRIRDLHDSGSAAPRAIERHHLFPKAHLARLGVTEQARRNAIANMAFLDWPENAEISDDDPSDYWPKYAASLSPDRLERQQYWHALPVGWEQLDYEPFLERRRELMAHVVRDGFASLSEGHSETQTQKGVAELIAAGESQRVEFKSTARFNLHTGQVDKKMEQVIVKTVAGFLNSEGGTLLIGVADNGDVLGLDNDYSTMSKGNRDGFELALRQRLETSLSSSTAATVSFEFDQVQDKDVCVLRVAPAGKPVFAKPLDGSSATEFWIRIGNATNQLHGEDFVSYKDEHWG